MLRIDILTIFPGMFEPALGASIIGRAREAGIVELAVHDLRRWTHDAHKTVDDRPFGGGAGMVLKPEPIFEAVEELLGAAGREGTEGAERAGEAAGAGGTRVVLLSPAGVPFVQALAAELAGARRLVLICGRYEGVDERVALRVATDEISVGDYVLSGGEIPALVVTDAVVRLLPGALGSEESAERESHSDGLLEWPQFTRPAEYRGVAVPAVLRSGDHGRIARWRRQQQLTRTLERRPDLLERAELSEEDKKFLQAYRATRESREALGQDGRNEDEPHREPGEGAS